MAYDFFVALHIGGAGATALIAAYSVAVLWRSSDEKYRICALALGTIAGFEILTGTVLSMLSIKLSALSLCANIAIYLAVVLLLEAVLFLRMKKLPIRFPGAGALSPIAGGLASLLMAVAADF